MPYVGSRDDGHPVAHENPDVICFSHLRWDFVYQRPQHLLTRCARTRRVYYVEEPLFSDGTAPYIECAARGNVTVATPHLPAGRNDHDAVLRILIDDLIASQGIREYVLWYYTPMALSFSDHLTPASIVYDCMDELSAFKGASSLLKDRERALLRIASLVLTGGQSLYEAKHRQHGNIHLFASSVDVNHFAEARSIKVDPADQANIPHPRLGFFGVIDERMDLELIAGCCRARPEWHVVMVGPVAKIDRDTLPALPNIHYLGPKTYNELPAYIAGWDVALLPFARNEATEFISPTKTPEYMAAGKPVVSTSIRDVVRPYGVLGLVRIADDVEAFARACDDALIEDETARYRRNDDYLRRMSWDSTWMQIETRMDATLAPVHPKQSSNVAAAAV